MADNLKRQASEMYRRRDDLEKIRTSEGLPVKKVVYASLAIVILALVAVQIFGGFSRRTDPIVAASTPPPLVKEAPPAELLQEAPAPKPEVAQPAVEQPVPPQAPPISQPTAPPAASAAPARTVEVPPRPQPAEPETTPAKPVLKRETSPEPAPRTARSKPVAPKPPETKAVTATAQPVMSDLERTRRELAREIVLEKNAQLAGMISGQESRGWEAEPLGQEDYAVTFLILDQAAGTPVKYVWKVNLSARTAIPLSYYARRLSS